MTMIGKHEYIYQAGNAPNRKIEFFGDGQRIWGAASGKSRGCWEYVCSISEDNMALEMASIAKKVEIFIEARNNGKAAVYPEDQSFNTMPYDKRVEIIKNLSGYKICINTDWEYPGLEKAESLIIAIVFVPEESNQDKFQNS